MKKNIVLAAALVGLATVSAGCAAGRPADGAAARTSAEQWVAAELSFESAARADGALEMDVVFARGGRELSRPAFWDGGKAFRVRFAAPETGAWTWRTVCRDEPSLDGLRGELDVAPYSGELEIYRRGFVTAQPGKKHFVYADGTPFLYLGDTHWGFGRETCDDDDNPGERHVETVVRRRVEQGFTVWQSEPLGARFELSDGTVDESDIPGLRSYDRSFKIVADAGLVHANAQFFFPSQMKPPLATNDAAIRALSRHWVGRYGAYPVMWTLGQEVDNDFYRDEPWGGKWFTVTNNPYLRVAEQMHAADCYGHPLSAHQENAGCTTIHGAGSSGKQKDGGRSIFADPAVRARTGHNWWAAQWSPDLRGKPHVPEVKDYWNDPDVAVDYEGRYCGLWTLDFGARAQAWIIFLNGFRGYGYGAADLWLFKSTYDMEKPSKDDLDVISVEEKHTPWRRALEYPSANQMIHFRRFMERLPWWDLVPDFNEGRRFRGAPGAAFSCASLPDGRIAVAYLFNRSRASGSFAGLPPLAEVEVEWFNPRTGEAGPVQRGRADADGAFALPPKPDDADWTVLLKRTEEGAKLMAQGKETGR